MSSQTILYLIVGVLTFDFVLERILEMLNKSKREKHLPEKLKGIYDEEKYKKSQEYGDAKDKLGLFSSLLSFVVTLTFLLLGGFGWLDGIVSSYTENLILATLLFFGIITIANDIIGIPLELYGTFVIEEKFGFNKMSVGTYIGDKIKGAILGVIIGGLLLTLFVWFYETFREMFWLYAWAIFIGFSLLMTMFYTNIIVPIFNKLTPLEDGELRTAIEDYAKSVSFPLKNIFVVDGSKRSTKANAYFSGLGKTKSIVLYDTLIEKHEIPELVSVLAHEVGHYKKKHTLQGFFLSGLIMFITLFVMHLTIDTPELSTALGAKTHKLYLGLVAFSILYSPLSIVTGLMMNLFSRKNEFEADEYAAKTSSSEALEEALRKLSVDSLSNLTPHPAYVFFHYSHPPLLQRVEALRKYS